MFVERIIIFISKKSRGQTRVCTFLGAGILFKFNLKIRKLNLKEAKLCEPLKGSALINTI